MAFNAAPYVTAYSSFICGFLFYMLTFAALSDKYRGTNWVMRVVWIATLFISINWISAITWLIAG